VGSPRLQHSPATRHNRSLQERDREQVPPRQQAAGTVSRCFEWLSSWRRREPSPNAAVPAASKMSPRLRWIEEKSGRREQTHERDPSGSASTGCNHNSRTVNQLKNCRKIANFVFDSRRLHQPSSINMGLRALRSRRLHYFSTAARLVSVQVSNNRMAASSAAGLRCMYRCVVPRSWCPASSWMALAGAPRIAR
jgi:hypothetical protein